MSLQTGQTFGKYTIVSLLGRGGMAEVYVARDPVLDREVAIKILHAHFVDEPDFLERFRSEARAVARLRHPAIIQVFDFDVADGQPYMAMEYLRGGSVKQRLARAHAAGEALAPDEVLALARLLGPALDYAHEEGLIHRDIKPSNILLTASSEPVLADFGIALMTGAARQTTGSTVTGTPAYMAPEQGQGKADARSDFYSLAVVLYELLAGRTPFSAETPTEMLLKHLQATPPSPLTWRGDLPNTLEPLFARALAKQPGERYQSGAALVRALEEALGAEPAAPVAALQEAVTVRDEPVTERELVGEAAPAPTPPRASPPPSPAPPPSSAVKRAATKLAQGGTAQRAIGGLAALTDLLAPLLGKQRVAYDPAAQSSRERLTAILAIVGIFFAALQYVVSTLDLLSRSLSVLWNALPLVTFLALALGAFGAAATLRSAAPEHRKHLAVGALVAIVLAGGGWLGWQVYDRIRPPAGPIVLIADFERCASCPEIEFGRRIHQRVKQETDRLDLPGVEVRRVLETFPDAASARARGKEQKAVVVIWGSYDAAGILPHLEVLEVPSFELPFQFPIGLVAAPAQNTTAPGGVPPFPANLIRPEDLSTADFHLEGGDREAAFLGLLGLGLARFSAGDPSNAIRLFDAATQQLPATPQAAPNAEYAHYLKGVTLLRSGAPPGEALASLRKAVELKPNLSNAHAWLGLAYLSYCTPEGASTYDRALAEAETAVRLHPDAISHWVLGVVQFYAGRYSAAATSFERSLQAREDVDVRAWLAASYRKTGRIELAQSEERKIAEAAKASPPSDEVQRLKRSADQLYEAGDKAGAVLDYQRALTRATELKRPPNTLSSLHMDLGLTLMAQEHYTDALESLEVSQALAGSQWRGNAAKGLAWMRLGQNALAETAFREALDTNPCDVSAQSLLGDMYAAQNMPQKALEAYRKVTALEPFNGLPWLNIATQHSVLGNTTEAEAAWHAAVPLLAEAARQQPTSANHAYLLGATYFLLKQYESALPAFRKVVELKPADGYGHYYLGASLAALGRHAEAVPELEIALKAFPDDALAMLDLAEAYQKTQRNLEAFAIYQKIVTIDKQSIGGWLGIANLAVLLGNWNEAARAWEALVGLAPNDADARASLAYAYMQLKRYGAAAREYHTAAQAASSNLRHRAGEAWALAMDGQADDALAITKEVLSSAPKGDMAEALAHYAAGLAHKSKGQRAEAILAFQAAIQSSPNKELRELAEAELTQMGS